MCADKCAYLEHGDDRFLVRIYNNGGNEARVRYEHAVLAALAPHAKSLPFRIPEPMPALADGATYKELAAGGASPGRAHACLFPVIPGGSADPKCAATARAIGVATAQLVAVMAGVAVDLGGERLPNPLYRHFYDAHQ